MIACLLAGVGACGYAQVPMVSTEMKALEPMLGVWTGTVKWFQGGIEGQMQASMTNSMDGPFMKTTGEFLMGQMKMTETAFTWWDKKAKLYKTQAYASFADQPRTESGTFKNNTMVMTSEPWDFGMGPTRTRATLTMKSGGTMSFLLEFELNKKWEKSAEGTLTKAQTATPPDKSGF